MLRPPDDEPCEAAADVATGTEVDGAGVPLAAVGVGRGVRPTEARQAFSNPIVSKP